MSEIGNHSDLNSVYRKSEQNQALLTSLSTHKTRLKVLPLLVLLVAGWIVSPILHDISNAVERASMMHVHGKEDGVSLREGCDLVAGPRDECLFCLTKIVSGLKTDRTHEELHVNVTQNILRDEVLISQVLMSVGARAPPLFG